MIGATSGCSPSRGWRRATLNAGANAAGNNNGQQAATRVLLWLPIRKPGPMGWWSSAAIGHPRLVNYAGVNFHTSSYQQRKALLIHSPVPVRSLCPRLPFLPIRKPGPMGKEFVAS